jgi:putative addiction module component (TIGR02574 family)
MSSPTDALLDSVLRLSKSERARIAAELMVSLDGEPEPDVEAAWATEVKSRIELVEKGQAQLLDWDVVKEEVSQSLKRR